MHVCCASIIPSECSGTQSSIKYTARVSHSKQSKNRSWCVCKQAPTSLALIRPTLADRGVRAVKLARLQGGSAPRFRVSVAAVPALHISWARRRQDGKVLKIGTATPIPSGLAQVGPARQPGSTGRGLILCNKKARRKLCWTIRQACCDKQTSRPSCNSSHKPGERTLTHSRTHTTNTRTNTPLIAGPAVRDAPLIDSSARCIFALTCCLQSVVEQKDRWLAFAWSSRHQDLPFCRE